MVTRNVIVVGIEGRGPAMRAAEWAAREAQLRNADLELVHAVTAPVFGSPEAAPTMTPTVPEIVRAEAAAMVRAVRASLLRSHPDLEIHCRLVEKPVASALRTAAEGALMTVVGSGQLRPFAAGLFGSVATAVAEHSADPVVVVRPPDGEVPTTGPVLVALDGGSDSNAALEFALEEASLAGREVIAVHTWTVDAYAGNGSRYPSEVDTVTERQSEHRLLAEQLAGWDQKYPDVVVHRDVRRGRASAAVLDACRTYQPALLVVGSRGHNAVTSLFLGSTSRDLLARATCPVAVVRGSR